MECSVTLPDGREIKASSTTHKSQWRNRKVAERVLVSRIRDVLKPERERSDLSEVVRTYHAIDDRVTDHASRKQGSYKRIVIKGKTADFAVLVDARREAME
jgi:protein subunit release factor A